MVRKTAAVLLSAAAVSNVQGDILVHKHQQKEELSTAANPIRKVVTMMQKMSKKLDEEAKAEEELYEKFQCYCKKTKTSLEDAINKAVSVGPITPEDIEAKKNGIKSLEAEVAKLKGEKIDDEKSLKAAKVNRNKEHDLYIEVVMEDKETEDAAESALKALGVSTTEGPTPAFIQTDSHTETETGFGVGVGSSWLNSLLKAFDHSKKTPADQREKAAAFLQGKGSASPGDSADVKVIIEDVEHEAEDHIVVEDKEEDNEVVDYKHVKTSKKDEISALLNQMERKMKGIGKLQVEVVNMQHDMANGAETLAENKKMLAEVTKSCDAKASEWEERKKFRADEQVAISEAIKMLNSDDALELFKKTIKNPALVQLQAGHQKALQNVKAIVDSLRAKNTENRPALNFLALALSGKKVDFTTVFKKIDELIALMKKEQVDDQSKKEYCNAEFDSSSDKIKGINKKLTETEADIKIGKAGIEKLEDEMAALQAGVQALDASITEASANRKAEHAAFGEMMQGNSAAVKLIGLAKNRLQEFYNPSLAADTATTTANPLDPYAFVQVAHRHRAEPVETGTPPPTFGGDYKAKGEESNGIMKMMDTLVNDLEKEMTVAQVEEKNAQKEYEETTADAAKKRESDLKAAASKASGKADLLADLENDKSESKAKKTELVEVKKYVSELHGECDWLLQNFDLRKSARTEEAESMTRAKAVLAGADFGF